VACEHGYEPSISVNTVSFLTSYATISFSRTLLHGVGIFLNRISSNASGDVLTVLEVETHCKNIIYTCSQGKMLITTVTQ
jgi:hypothetical protein